MLEPTQTLTAVKTKTVTRTQMAVALACLGASIIAAAAMSIALNNASAICVSNAKINVALTLGQGELVSACKGQLIVPTPKFSQLLVRNYNDEVLTLLVDKKYVTFKVGEDYKLVGKPLGEVIGYQQNLYVAYSGKVDKKADINLFYGYPAGEKGVFCSDTDESQQNYDGSSVKDFKFVNPYVKGTVSYYDEGLDEMVPVEDSCTTFGYGYGSDITITSTSTDLLTEYYCSTADGGSQLHTWITCEGGCVDGACVPVIASSTPTSACVDSDGGKDYGVKGYATGVMEPQAGFEPGTPPSDFYDTCDKEKGSAYLGESFCYTKEGNQYVGLGAYDCAKDGKTCKDGACVSISTTPITQQVGTMNLVSGGKLATNKLKAGENEVAKLSFTASNEDVLVNQLIFTFDPAGNFKPGQIQSVVLKDGVGNVVGGPQIVKQYGAKYQVVLQNPPKGLFTLSSATNESQNYSLYATVNDPALLYDSVSGFRVSIDTVKDVTAVGSKTLTAIKSINKKLLSFATMYGSAPLTDSVLNVVTSKSYSDDKIFTVGQEVNLADIIITNLGKSPVTLKSIKFTQTVTDTKYASFTDFSKLWLVDKSGAKLSDDIIPSSGKQEFTLKSGGQLFTSNQIEDFTLKGVVNQIGAGAATSGHGLRYKVASNSDINAVYVDGGSQAKVELKKLAGDLTSDLWPLVYIFKAYPTVSKLSVDSTKLMNGTRDLYKFKVTAVSGDISMYKFNFLMNWTGNVSVGDLYLYDVTNGENEMQLNTKPGVKQNSTPGNAIWSTVGSEWKDNFPAGEIVISKEQPRVFVLRGNVNSVTNGSSVTTKLLGAGGFFGEVSLKQSASMGTAEEVNGLAGYNSFIWSDRNSVTHSILSKDWTTGHDIPGLPLAGAKFETLVY